jgi:hypothetical protein
MSKVGIKVIRQHVDGMLDTLKTNQFTISELEYMRRIFLESFKSIDLKIRTIKAVKGEQDGTKTVH